MTSSSSSFGYRIRYSSREAAREIVDPSIRGSACSMGDPFPPPAIVLRLHDLVQPLVATESQVTQALQFTRTAEVPTEHIAEVVSLQRQQLCCLTCHDTRGPRHVQQQRDLAEGLARAKRGEQLASALNRDAARTNHVEPLPRLALADDGFTRSYRDEGHAGQEHIELGRRQIAEQRHRRHLGAIRKRRLQTRPMSTATTVAERGASNSSARSPK